MRGDLTPRNTFICFEGLEQAPAIGLARLYGLALTICFDFLLGSKPFIASLNRFVIWTSGNEAGRHGLKKGCELAFVLCGEERGRVRNDG
jgi:hypothetical protein